MVPVILADKYIFHLLGASCSVCLPRGDVSKAGDILVRTSVPEEEITDPGGCCFCVSRRMAEEILDRINLEGYHFPGDLPIVRLMAVYIEGTCQITEEISHQQHEAIELGFLRLCRAAIPRAVRFN